MHEISNNVVCATSKGSDQPANTHSLIRAFCSSLEYSMSVKLLTEHHLVFLSLKGGCIGSSESTHVKMPHCWKLHVTAQLWKLYEEIRGKKHKKDRRTGKTHKGATHLDWKAAGAWVKVQHYPKSWSFEIQVLKLDVCLQFPTNH